MVQPKSKLLYLLFFTHVPNASNTFHIKYIFKVYKEMYLNIIKTVYDKPITNIPLNGEKLSPSRKKDKYVHSHHFFST